MSIANEIQRLQGAKAELKTAIESKGVSVPSATKIDGYAALVRQVRNPATLPVEATTVRISASQTENVASNDNIKIKGDDGNYYTLAAWNALFVAAGYDKDAMGVEPIGLKVDAFDQDDTYLFDRPTGQYYNPVGDSQGSAGQLQLSLYNNPFNPPSISSPTSGTDFTTNKGWTVTPDGDNLILSEANTGQSWTIAKDTGNVNAHLAFNAQERTYSLWAQNEWMRHRMAIDSGIATSKEDGTYGEIQILNSSGVQAAVGEDMYFWIKNDSNVLVNTNKLAKYNLNNLHNTNSAHLTSAIADAIYDRQVANGINMNDTGVNSASKPVLAPGSKGAEVIAVGGYWYIITPFISNANITTSTATNNMADSPAIYWAIAKGCDIPTDPLINALYFNKVIVNAYVSYLNSREGRSFPVIPNGSIWSCVRQSQNSAWYILTSSGVVFNNITFSRYYVAGSTSS